MRHGRAAEDRVGPDVDRPRAVELFDRHGLGGAAIWTPRFDHAASSRRVRLPPRRQTRGRLRDPASRTTAVASSSRASSPNAVAFTSPRARRFPFSASRRAPPRRSRSRIRAPLRVPPVAHAADEGVEESRTERERFLGALVDRLAATPRRRRPLPPPQPDAARSRAPTAPAWPRDGTGCPRRPRRRPGKPDSDSVRFARTRAPGGGSKTSSCH